MKISLNWLREYVDYDGTPEALAELLTMAGVEVEGIESRGVNLDKVVVAQVLSREPHPNADRLSVCRVDDGSGSQPPRQIVCGAKNFSVGDKVPLALPGAVLPGDVKIKVGKLRGVESEGMMCSGKELRLADDAEGLLILSPEAPVGAAIGELYPADTVLDLEVTPNRSDLLSHVGLAREVAALTGREFRDPVELMETPPGGEPEAALPVMIAANARQACPFYSARVINDVQVGPSPDWLRARLESVGLRPINNVVDVTNYVMLELGQPLHTFDAAHVGRGGVGVRLASPGEELLALDGRTYPLQPHHLVIAAVDGGRAEGLAGVMGGEESGITARTNSIILESAYFAPASVRRTSRELGLSSDASYRFERGVDPHRVLAASRRAEDLIAQLCGGQSGGVAHTHHLTEYDAIYFASDTPVPLRLSRCQQVLGTDITADEVDAILTRLGLEKLPTGRFDDGADGDLEDESSWHVPSYRPDLRREIDLIEEVSRVFGLDAVPGRVEARFVPPSDVDAAYDFQMGLRRRLVGLGFAEARTGALVRQDAGVGGMLLKNPLNEENAVLRGTLLPGLLAVAERNARLGTADLRLFEVGRLFIPGWPEGHAEPRHLCLVMTGAAQPPAWRHGNGGSRTLDLHDLRGVVEALCAPATVELRPADAPISGESLALLAQVLVDGKPAGSLGQLSPAKARALELRGDGLVAELELSALQAAAGSARRFRTLARFPSVTRDLAVVVDRALAHGRIDAALRGAHEPLLAGVELFDVFTDDRGEKIAAGRKSLAYSLTYRAEDRTLKTEEVNAAHARLKAALQAGFDGLQFRE